ncbi:DUF3800 domain-containing protein [Kocuria sp. cx-455]|uniref:DUF3800 domain-containing protein n=1 Tax=Kocuria sp. cx-455 TaxID=2771377 RepID=UPI001682D5B1|nr:DUF3800 domain-containing protein [Kocuria sp. cx-455]MBD2764224.1 DUF3800 domain-containing protein [Kocuria sp. cx-455]
MLATSEQLAVLEGTLEDWRSEELVTKYGIDPETEFHGHRVMQGRAPWQCMHGQVHEAVWVYREFFKRVVASGVLVYMEGVDVARLNARYKYPDPPYEITLRHLLENVNAHARSAKDEVYVVADNIQDKALYSAAIEGYTRTGTPGYKFSTLQHIQQPIRFRDSHTEMGLQAADMVVYLMRRHLEPELGQSTRARRATRSLYGTLEPAIASCRKWYP